MTYTPQAKNRGLRRVATLLAALGMLVMSSGVALMVTSTSANAAADKVGVCHATSSDSNPYVYIVVDVNSAKLKGHLMHRNDPNKRWKTDGYFSGVHHVAGQLKPDLIGSFTDTNGVFHQEDGNITASSCENHPLLATASVTFKDPTCADPSVDYTTSGSHVTFSVLSGSKTAGTTIVVRATADGGAAFATGNPSILDFHHTFGAVPTQDQCGVESPNVVTPLAPTFTEPTCDTPPSYTLPSAPVVTRKLTGPELQTKDVLGVHYVVTGSLTDGGTIDVDATPILPNIFATDPAPTSHWEHTFTTPTGCTSVSPPVVKPPVVKPPVVEPPAVTPTLVHAGLISTVTPDLRGQRGLALMIAGLLLLVAGGGLGLVRPGGQSRS
ncbi:MAG: hypothetical protein JWQ32_1673 [Marmoricola sp.]|nr:hypothetical protein [Marmoricola sp.]